MKAEINVHVCDDHQMMIDGLNLLMADIDGIKVVGKSHNGVELLSWLETEKTDVILLDINMPVMDGITACQKISKLYPEVKVIFLSMINQSSIVHSLIESGAKGYLLKNSGYDELSEAISKVNAGGVYFDDKVFKIEDKADTPFKTNIIPKLTKREKEVLSLIMQEYTSMEMAKKLFISHGTIETHRRNLISKLGVKNTAGLVRVAMEKRLLG